MNPNLFKAMQLQLPVQQVQMCGPVQVVSAEKLFSLLGKPIDNLKSENETRQDVVRNYLSGYASLWMDGIDMTFENGEWMVSLEVAQNIANRHKTPNAKRISEYLDLVIKQQEPTA